MNRIILIGNGFDLAHGMKTSYRNFIDNYWEKTIDDIRNTRSRFYENAEIRINNTSTLFLTNNMTAYEQ